MVERNREQGGRVQATWRQAERYIVQMLASEKFLMTGNIEGF